ncbi:sensor histidine kinase [Nocardia uniformis]|uniref:histidine kinase n=2 Tax=Nocardia uniformis TaxID=53432 RepID=A0A849CAY5_9NOCA|nr:sensor histidine kinase [Nocardia uniformis]
MAIALCATVTAAFHYRAENVRLRRDAEQFRRVLTTAATDAAAHIETVNENATRHAREAQSAETRRAAAMAAFAGAAGRMQAMTTSMLAELREMEHRHADPAMLTDLLHLDHRTAQAGRLADSIAVLSGARSGRRWAKPIAMESILRGAMGRVAGYQRVRLRAISDIAVSGHAAEGVMHALAELLDNACNFSPPTTEVHVYAAEVPAGVVITIEDSGLVMSESALRRAESAVSGGDGRDIRSDLSSLTGTRLGLAVVGHLARKHGLTVSYRPSAIGGTAVVVVVPRDLTARIAPAQRTLSPMAAAISDRSQSSGARPGSNTGQFASTGAQLASTVAPSSITGEQLVITGEQPAIAPIPPAPTESVLPKRQRGSTLAAVHPQGLSTPNPVVAPAAPSKPSALGAFQRAVSGRDSASTTTPSSENDR